MASHTEVICAIHTKQVRRREQNDAAMMLKISRIYVTFKVRCGST